MNEDRCVCCGEYVPEGSMVCSNCISKTKSFEQVVWERDMTISQLNSYGVSLCKKADITKVVYAKWVVVKNAFLNWLNIKYLCSRCSCFSINRTNYCPDCGACMDKDIELKLNDHPFQDKNKFFRRKF